MRPEKRAIGFLLAFVMLFAAPVLAADDEKKLHEQAAQQLIDSMPDFFRDVAALQKMTPEQKIDYILTKSEGRIKEKIAEKFQSDMEEKLTKYTQEAIRAKAFMTDAVPKIRHAYATGTSFNWGSLDADINSSVDTKMRAFGAALSTAKIGWGAYEAYSSGGGLEAFKSISAEVYDLLAEAYIPGWAYFKLGKELVEILGRYVLDYATDTAVEGMLNDMYGMKSNPQGLAEWLINKSPADIERDLNGKWDDGMGFGRLWEGQGTDKGDEAMKERISSTLISLRGELLVHQKEEERKQKELTDKLNQYVEKAKNAEAEMRSVAQKARDAAKVELEKIREFRYKLTGIDQQVAEDRFEQQQEAFESDNSKVNNGQTYKPIDRGPILAALEEILGQIHEDGRGGYDNAATHAAMDQYKKIRHELVERAAVENGFARYRWPDTKWGKDVAALSAQENAMRLEAKERLLKRSDAIREAVRKITSDIEQAGARHYQAMRVLEEEISSSLHDGNHWRGNSEAVWDYTKSPDVFSQPGDVVDQLEALRRHQKEMIEDEALLGGLHAKEKRAFTDFVSDLAKAKEVFKAAIPDNLFSVEAPSDTVWNVSEWLVVGSFYQDQIKVDPQVMASCRISMPAMGGMSFAEYEQKVLNVPPGEVIRVERKTLDRRISFLESIADADAMARSFMALFSRVMSVKALEETSRRDLSQEKKYLAEVFHTEMGMSGQFMHVELSKGFAYLNDLKAAWSTHQAAIDKLEPLMKGMGRRVRYSFDLQGGMYPPARNLVLLPEKIKAAEEEYQKAREITMARLGLADKYLGEWKAAVQRLEDGPGNAQYRAQEFEKIARSVKNQVGLLRSWGSHPDVLERLKNVTDFQEELLEKLAQAKAEHQKSIDDLYRESEARQTEQARLKEEEARRAQEEAERAAAPVIVMYNLMNPRLNTVSLRQASGDVVVSQSDLKAGALEVAARLDTMETIAALLASEDGITWKELPLAQDIVFSFIPMPGRSYMPVLRIKTTDFRDLDMPFFPNIRSLVYQDVDHIQMVAEAVRVIAEAYERSDIGTFSDRISRDYLGNKTTLEEGVRFDFDMFTDIRLKIYIDRIQRRADQFVAETHWDKSQAPRKTGEQQKTTGKTTMMFVMEEGKLRVRNLRGNLIYATLSPDIAQASGLPSSVVDDIRTAQEERNPVQPGAGSTIDDGGVTTSTASNIQTGTFSIVQQHAHPGMGAGWVQEFSFANYQVYDAPATLDVTYDFRRREGWMEVNAADGIQDLGVVDINSVASVPASGYAAQAGAEDGHCYAIELSDGTYALVRPTVYPPNGSALPFTTTFQYRHQTNGTRSF